MQSYNRQTWGLVVILVCAPFVSGAEAEAQQRARVELRWVEEERIAG
jgi:hypothetical protein